MTVPVDRTSLAGYVALTQTPLILADAHHLPLGAPYRVNTFVQEEYGYWRKSIFTMPLIDHEGEVVAVMQLANRKRDPAAILNTREDVEKHTIPYSDHDVMLAQSIAGQAAVSIENAQLYEQIEHLLECFVRASVTAIDQRDPATSGHSVRVATLVTDLAKALERSGRGAYRGLRFSPAQMRELRYAALLHDFGKVGVREEVLIKARKLTPAMWARVETRFDLIRCTMYLEYERKRTAALEAGKDASQIAALAEQFTALLAELDRYWATIAAANEPTVLPHEAVRALDEIATHKFIRADGRIEPYLTEEELHFLRIPQGTLDELERLEVQSHATQTFDFLAQIPWTSEMKDIASHASAHHEKLNGSGYPHHLTADDIPLQARIIAIADVFDALTSADRPYKPAVSADAALAILRQEANEGLLDPDIVDVLVESQVYRRVMEEDWRGL
jgi:HD-GYP domain-containing protein (c-di-GMP phosphodiesterase class II)